MNKYTFRPYRKPLQRLKNGKFRYPGKSKYKWFTEPHTCVKSITSGQYQPIKLTKFDATDAQIRTWLKSMYNFEFQTYTEKGNVKVDRDELARLGSFGEDLIRLIKVKKDLSQLSGTDNSLMSRFNPSTNAIHGRVDTIGAATHRATHSVP